MKMEKKELFETSTRKIQTPGNHPKKNKTFTTPRMFEIKK